MNRPGACHQALPLSALQQAGRAPALPLTLCLEGVPLRVRQWLRVLPGQRYVAVAEWQGRAVLAKLLVGPRAERHYRREYQGARLLLDQGLPSPELLANGYDAAEGAWLLFDYLAGARGLGLAWQQVASQPLLSETQHQIIRMALQLIARLHARGLWQDDLHLDNLLYLAGRLYLIDGGGVRAEVPGRPLSLQRIEENLGVFFAQLPASVDPFIEVLLASYRLGDSSQLLMLDALLEETARARRWRLRDLLKKTGRDCSLFSVCQQNGLWQALCRAEADWLAPLLADPDALLAGGERYKSGGTATVARLEQAGRTLVIKRYNIKNWRHGLSRCWRPSRAWHSWREAHRLALLGIATPKPLAVIERRWHGLRRQAWLLTEWQPGPDILDAFAPWLDGQVPEPYLLALDQLFAALCRERVSHGDLKGHNLLWDAASNRWVLIDLDGLHQYGSPRCFARAWRRDRQRFLRNWPARSALYRLLDARLPKTA